MNRQTSTVDTLALSETIEVLKAMCLSKDEEIGELKTDITNLRRELNYAQMNSK